MDVAVVSSSRAHLSSLVSMLLLVKVMAPKWTLVVVSSMVTPAVQTLESVRTGCTSCSSLSRTKFRVSLVENPIETTGSV